MLAKVDVDELWLQLGTWGRYQKFQIMLLLVDIIPLAFHLLSTVFITYRPPFQCAEVNVSRIVDDNIKGDEFYATYSDCQIDIYKNISNTTGNNELFTSTTCIEGYNYSIPRDRSVTTELNLVCKGAEMAEFSQTLVILGQAFGASCFTPLADKYGRRTVHVLCHIILFIMSLSLSFTTSYTAFAIIRFCIGAFQQGAGLTIAILILELLPRNSRYIGEGFGLFFWTTGVVLITPAAYLLRNFSWRYLQIALACFSCYSLIEWFLLDESLRWLIANKKLDQAEKNIRKAAKMNKKDYETIIKSASKNTEVMSPIVKETPQPIRVVDDSGNYMETEASIPEVYIEYTQVHAEQNVKVEKYNVLTIFKHKRILKNSCILWYSWFVNSGVYYALTLMASSLSGNRFLNFFLLAIVEYPAAFTQLSIVNRIGRRKTCILFHTVTSSALVIKAGIDFVTDSATWATIGVVFFLIGKFGVAGSFSTIFLYTPELYPTNLRNAGIGVSSAFARIGGMLAPFAAPLALHVPWAPGVISAIMGFVTVALMYFLPETAGHDLPTTIKELKQWYKDNRAGRSIKQNEEKLYNE